MGIEGRLRFLSGASDRLGASVRLLDLLWHCLDAIRPSYPFGTSLSCTPSESGLQIRDLYWTIRNFRNRVRDFLRYRRVTSRMDLFPNADEADLARCDNVCIICREEMTMATVNKKLPCGHVFHVHCLRSWLERQQSCPICRNPVFPPREPEPVPQNVPQGQEAEPQADHLRDVPALLQVRLIVTER